MLITLTLNPVLDRTLTVPRIEFDEMIRATTTRLDWGGKGFNVSRTLKALGLDSVAMGFVGGATGQMLERGLNKLGIATDFVHIGGETRTNVVIVDEQTGRYIKVNEAGPEVGEGEAIACFELAGQRMQAGDWWALCGSLPPGTPIDFYAQFIEMARERGARIMLDASGDALRLGCAARPFLVKPNAVEAQEMSGIASDTPGAALQACGWFLEQGIELVALSMGAEGLVLASTAQAVWARPPAVRARNPTGAGDALLAGIMGALAGMDAEQLAADRLDLAELARWAVGAGTAAALSPGVSPGSKDDVEAIRRQVQIEHLA